MRGRLSAGANPTSDEIKRLIYAMSSGVIHSPGYNPFANLSEFGKREWLLFMLFQVKQLGRSLEGAQHHFEWLRRNGWDDVSEWLGEEGSKYRCRYGMSDIPRKTKKAWGAFFAAHASRDIPDLDEELNWLADEHAGR